jgi:multicomponent Na+:H+ antiporter subunit D
VVVSAATGAAVLRAGGRIWFGLGPVPAEAGGSGTGGGGESEDQEKREMAVPERHVRVSLLAPIALLLAGSLAVGAVPAVARAVSTAAVQFVDRAGYVDQALRGGPAIPSSPLPEAAWTSTGVLLGLLSAVLALGGAAAALWAPRLPELVRAAGRPLAVVLDGLRRVHSGHIGDYVAWLFLGTTAVAALVGLPLL